MWYKKDTLLNIGGSSCPLGNYTIPEVVDAVYNTYGFHISLFYKGQSCKERSGGVDIHSAGSYMELFFVINNSSQGLFLSCDEEIVQHLIDGLGV